MIKKHTAQFLKWGKDMNTQFMTKDTQTIYKHMKRYMFKSLLINANEIHYEIPHLLEWLKFSKPTIPSGGIRTLGRRGSGRNCKMVQLWKTVCQSLKKLHMHVSYNLAILLLEKRKRISIKNCIWMFLAGLFAIAQNRKHPKLWVMWMSKQSVRHPRNRIVLSSQEEWAHCRMNEAETN